MCYTFDCNRRNACFNAGTKILKDFLFGRKRGWFYYTRDDCTFERERFNEIQQKHPLMAGLAITAKLLPAKWSGFFFLFFSCHLRARKNSYCIVYPEGTHTRSGVIGQRPTLRSNEKYLRSAANLA